MRLFLLKGLGLGLVPLDSSVSRLIAFILFTEFLSVAACGGSIALIILVASSIVFLSCRVLLVPTV